MSNNSPRYLTKSRFKLAMECPTKLYYTRKEEYPDKKKTDPFLEALADGGFQVGELAKHYFPQGIEVKSLNYEEAEKQTQALLQRKNVTIFEPAIRWQNLFIRIDILVKEGNRLNLIEVKAKSIKPQESFTGRNGDIYATWKPYLYDVAFQTYVLRKAMPDYTVSSVLMLADKASRCPTDGLNQKFRITRNENDRKSATITSSITDDDLKEMILRGVNVDKHVEMILNGKDIADFSGLTFDEVVFKLAHSYANDNKIPSPIGTKCAKCEFTCTEEEEKNGKKSGYKECWSNQLGWVNDDFNSPSILQLWGSKKQFIKSNKFKLTDLIVDDICPKPDGEPGLSSKERQWLQVKKVKNNDNTIFIDYDGLTSEMEKWSYPLHFIDFETAMVPIPFNRGRHPYEVIAFQFSHHVVYGDGHIEHFGQYLNVRRGIFPNYEFIRELKAQLDKDHGTIFRYHHHENTYLNKIYTQLQEDDAPPEDKEILCDFIKSITYSSKSSKEKWKGERCMVDLWKLEKRYYYNPLTNGSNSIKQVLPAVLNTSKYLQEKYSEKIYGARDGIKSCNFRDWQWVSIENDKVLDPYNLLPKLFRDLPDDINLELISDDEELKEGGAAQTAYCRMQFEEMGDYERNEITQALLKYCELDTFAMVMIYEAWKDMVFPEIA